MSAASPRAGLALLRRVRPGSGANRVRDQLSDDRAEHVVPADHRRDRPPLELGVLVEGWIVRDGSIRRDPACPAVVQSLP